MAGLSFIHLQKPATAGSRSTDMADIHSSTGDPEVLDHSTIPTPTPITNVVSDIDILWARAGIVWLISRCPMRCQPLTSYAARIRIIWLTSRFPIWYQTMSNSRAGMNVILHTRYFPTQHQPSISRSYRKKSKKLINVGVTFSSR